MSTEDEVSRLKLLVEGFVEDYDAWVRYDVDLLHKRGIISKQLRDMLVNHRAMQGIRALNQGFKDADLVASGARERPHSRDWYSFHENPDFPGDGEFDPIIHHVTPGQLKVAPKASAPQAPPALQLLEDGQILPDSMKDVMANPKLYESDTESMISETASTVSDTDSDCFSEISEASWTGYINEPLNEAEDAVPNNFAGLGRNTSDDPLLFIDHQVSSQPETANVNSNDTANSNTPILGLNHWYLPVEPTEYPRQIPIEEYTGLGLSSNPIVDSRTYDSAFESGVFDTPTAMVIGTSVDSVFDSAIEIQEYPSTTKSTVGSHSLTGPSASTDQPRMDESELGAGVAKSRLLVAIQTGQFDNVIVQLCAGVDVNTKLTTDDNAWITPLLAAVESGHEEIVRLLVNWGADVSGEVTRQTHDGMILYTPLQAAAKCGHISIARFLLEKGADIDSASTSPALQHAGYSYGKPPLTLAREESNTDMFRFLLTWDTSYKPGGKPINFIEQATLSKHAKKVHDLHRSVSSGKTDSVIEHLRTGADINAVSFNGTALSIAAKAGRYHIVKLLLKHSADPQLAGLYLTRSGFRNAAERLVKFAYRGKSGFQNLRAVFIRQYKHLRWIAQDPTTGLQHFVTCFPTYRRAWSAGIKAVEGVCRGNPPKTLYDTLSLLAVARAVAETLAVEKGDALFVDRFDGDLIRWQYLFSSQEDLLSYREASRLLWRVELTDFIFDDEDIAQTETLGKFQELVVMLIDGANDPLKLGGVEPRGHLSLGASTERWLRNEQERSGSLLSMSCSMENSLTQSELLPHNEATSFQLGWYCEGESSQRFGIPDPKANDHITAGYLIRGAIFAVIFLYLCCMLIPAKRFALLTLTLEGTN
jgi:ankyrin repeat protein